MLNVRMPNAQGSSGRWLLSIGHLLISGTRIIGHLPRLVTRLRIAILLRSFLPRGEINMVSELKPGGTVRVTINKRVNRATARKTLERLFMMDKKVAAPIATRSRNFKALPKRRGGTIWTKRPNKVHPDLAKGDAATIKATPQHLRDLASVSDFVEVAKA
jgi:hypothetical protein